MDGLKEQTSGTFKQKLMGANCKFKKIAEMYSPWSNATEAGICELKKGSSCKMIKTGSPKKVQDYCLELEAHIVPYTALGIFMLGSQVPELVMFGEAADISQICEFEWYQYQQVMFRDSPAQYSDDNMVLVRYLGPNIDVSPAMMAKILKLKANDQVIPCSTIHTLALNRIESPKRIELGKK